MRGKEVPREEKEKVRERTWTPRIKERKQQGGSERESRGGRQEGKKRRREEETEYGHREAAKKGEGIYNEEQ